MKNLLECCGISIVYRVTTFLETWKCQGIRLRLAKSQEKDPKSGKGQGIRVVKEIWLWHLIHMNCAWTVMCMDTLSYNLHVLYLYCNSFFMRDVRCEFGLINVHLFDILPEISSRKVREKSDFFLESSKPVFGSLLLCHSLNLHWCSWKMCWRKPTLERVTMWIQCSRKTAVVSSIQCARMSVPETAGKVQSVHFAGLMLAACLSG